MARSRSTVIGWIISIVIVVGGIAGLIFLAGKPAGNAGGNVPAVTTTDHLNGPATAPAIIIAYSDFQCPACGAYEPILQGLKTQFGENMTIVFRHFPLKSIHKYAEAAARASEAADLQGKFWEYHDLLYSRQSSWAATTDIDQALADYAKELTLDVGKFTTDYKSSAVAARVNRDVTDGLALGINSTPTFYLNGTHLDNPSSQQAFADLINAKIPK